MKRLLAIFLILFLYCHPAYAQWAKTFGKTIPDLGNSIRQTSDGGYVLTGQTKHSPFGHKVLVMRLGSGGNIVWQKGFGGTFGFHEGNSIQQTSDGGYIITGSIRKLLQYSDVLVLKLDSSGNMDWQKIFGGGVNDIGMSVQQTSDDGYIITGRTRFDGEKKSSVLVLRLDKLGGIVWQKMFGVGNYDGGTSIQQTSDGGYILTGFTGNFTFDGIGNRVLVLKLDASGNIVWQKGFSRTAINRGNSIQQTSDGGYILTGKTKSFGAGDYDVMVLRLDSDGNITPNCLSNTNLTERPGGTMDNISLIMNNISLSTSTPVAAGNTSLNEKVICE